VKHLDLETVIRLADEAIAEKGEDFIYVDEDGRTPGLNFPAVNCQYIHDKEGDKTPGCIAGHIMVAFGIDPDDIIPHENDDSNNLLWQLDQRGLIDYTREADEYLYLLQCRQDNGKTWGEARDNARRNLG
jgi:hypothetical protein